MTSRLSLPCLARQITRSECPTSSQVLAIGKASIASITTLNSFTHRIYKRSSAFRSSTGPQRTFCRSSGRRYAVEDENWDPRSEDREVDQVDVCIVGGGNVFEWYLMLSDCQQDLLD